MHNWLYCVIKCSCMPHLSRYHTLHVAMCEMRIWPLDAAKCCKNAGKFFPDESSLHSLSRSFFFGKIGIKRLILAPVVLKVVGVGGLVYIGLVGLGGFCGVVFKQRLAVII